jgi:cysteinyl-tRNA synthetase
MSLCTSFMASGALASRALVRGPRVGRGARSRLERLGGLPGRIATRPAPGAVRALHARDGGERYVERICLSTPRPRARTIERALPRPLSLARLTDKATDRRVSTDVRSHVSARSSRVSRRAPGTARAAKPHGAPLSLAHAAGSRRFTVSAVSVSSADAASSAAAENDAHTSEAHPMFLHNTQTRKKERFVPRDKSGKTVSMYVCGVTVYDYSHIGHARVYVAFDVLFRQLRSLGYDVTYVRNFTDVDDKIIKRANENGETCDALVDRFIDAFREDVKSLNCLPPTAEPKATKHMDEIIDMTERLVNSGNAYSTNDGDVYFAVDSLPEYGALSGRKLSDNMAGASDRETRSDVSKKKNPADFALWKAAKPGEPTWSSPWGEGRPGWHIECSAMIEKTLGPTIDIHGGGMDLTFPHHENELAQSTAANCACGVNHGGADVRDGKKRLVEPFVKYWVHNGFVKVDSEKMSKSLGNFFTIREVTEKYHPLALRWMLLGTHYRAPINYTRRALEEASDRLFYCYQTLADAKTALSVLDAESKDSADSATKKPKPPTGIAAEAIALASTTYEQTTAALADDLNTPACLAALSSPLKTLNDLVSTKKGKKAVGRNVALHELINAVEDALLRVGMPVKKGRVEGGEEEDDEDDASADTILHALRALALTRAGLTSADVDSYVARREEARLAKDFETSDAIRDELKSKGVALMDGAAGAGTAWRPCAVESE